MQRVYEPYDAPERLHGGLPRFPAAIGVSCHPRAHDGGVPEPAELLLRWLPVLHVVILLLFATCCARPAYAANTPEQEEAAAAYYQRILESCGITLTVYDFHGNRDEMYSYIMRYNDLVGFPQIWNALLVIEGCLDEVGYEGHNYPEWPILGPGGGGGQYGMRLPVDPALSGDDPWSAYMTPDDDYLRPDQVYGEWLRIAIDNGPEWTVSGGGSGGDGGPEVIDGVVTVPLVWTGLPKSSGSNPSSFVKVRVGAIYNSSINSVSGGVTTNYYYNKRQTSYTPVLPDGMQARIKAGLLDSYMDGNDIIIVSNPVLNQNLTYTYAYILPVGTYSIISEPSRDGGPDYMRISSSAGYRYVRLTNGEYIALTDGVMYACFNSVSQVYTRSAGTFDLCGVGENGSSYVSYYGYYSGGGDGGGGDDDTPQPFPDPPTGPDVPELPDPGGFPDIPEGPTPEWEQNGTSTTTVDLTPILDALRIINDNIITGVSVLDASIDGFAEYVQSAYEDWWQRARTWLTMLFNFLRGWFREIRQLLDPVAYYIRRIWYDLGEIKSDLEGLGALSDGDVGIDVDEGNTPAEQLEQDMEGLKRKFPFSLPWDLYALLHLLDAPPRSPSIDVSIPVPYTGESLVIRGDLDEWDPYMGAVRTFGLIAFAWSLALITNKVVSW